MEKSGEERKKKGGGDVIGDSDLKMIGCYLPLKCSWLKGGYNTTQHNAIR